MTCLIKGPEWGYLDNNKHSMFLLCNMKQLNFWHFNTYSKKFTITVNFIQKETKNGSKMTILLCLVYQEVFCLSLTIPDHFGRFRKISKD